MYFTVQPALVRVQILIGRRPPDGFADVADDDRAHRALSLDVSERVPYMSAQVHGDVLRIGQQLERLLVEALHGHMAGDDGTAGVGELGTLVRC